MTATIVLVALAVGTYGLKAAAPVLLGGRRLPERLARVAELLPAALLGALVVVSTISDEATLHVDARLVGVAAAAVALWRKAPFVVVVLVAAAATAVARL
jgi:branched-subunit amino acid transport protein AzlD